MSIYVARAGIVREGDSTGTIFPGGDGGGAGIPGGGAGNEDGADNPLNPGFVDSDDILYFWGEVKSNTKTFAALKTELDDKRINQAYLSPKPAYVIELPSISWTPEFDPDSYDGTVGGEAPEGWNGLFQDNYSVFDYTYLGTITTLRMHDAKVYSDLNAGFGDTVLQTNPGQTDVYNEDGICGSGNHIELTADSKRFTVTEPLPVGGTEIDDYGAITTTETVAGHAYIPDGEYYTVYLSVGIEYTSKFNTGFCPVLALDYILDDAAFTSVVIQNTLEFRVGGDGGSTLFFYVKAYFLKSTVEGKTIRFRWELQIDPGTVLLLHKSTSLYYFGTVLEDTNVEYDLRNIARCGLMLNNPANGSPDITAVVDLLMTQVSDTDDVYADFNIYYSYGLPYRWGDILSPPPDSTIALLGSTRTGLTTEVDISSILPVSGGANDGLSLYIWIVMDVDTDATYDLTGGTTVSVDEIRFRLDDTTTLGDVDLTDGDILERFLDGKEGYITSGVLTVGEKYRILSITGSASFTAVGADTELETYDGTEDNQVGAIFTATAATPTWGTGGALYNQNPTHFQVLEVIDE